jgi:hypothetical protein
LFAAGNDGVVYSSPSSPDGSRPRARRSWPSASARSADWRHRLAVVLDDGALVIETLGPHALDEFTGMIEPATTYRIPR